MERRRSRRSTSSHEPARLFPDRVGVHRRRAARVVPTRRSPSGATGWRGRCSSDLGVRPGDRVAWLCGNTHELLEAYYGVLLAGAVLLPAQHPARAAPRSAVVLDDSGAAVLFRHPDQPDPDHPRATGACSATSTRRCSPRSPPTPFPVAGRRRARAGRALLHVGLDRHAEGAMLTHRGLYLHAVHNALTAGSSGDDVVLHTIPLFHVNGWGTPHYVTGLGGVHVMLPRFDAGEVLRLIEAERVTRLFLVPTMARSILDHPSLDGRDLSSCGRSRSAARRRRPELLAEVEQRLGLRVHLRLRDDRVEPARSPARSTSPASRKSLARRSTTGTADPRRRRARASTTTTTRCRGTARRSARSWLGRTT